MTREMMVELIEALGDDVEWILSGDTFHVDLQDFEGFDDDWEEIFRDYDDEEAVEAFIKMLETECASQEGDFYVDYHFNGFSVRLGYSSFDI